MNTIARMMLAAVLAATAAVGMAESKTTYRDAQGRIQSSKATKQASTLQGAKNKIYMTLAYDGRM